MKRLLALVLASCLTISGCGVSSDRPELTELMIMNNKDYYWSLGKENNSIEVECSGVGQHIRTTYNGGTNFISVVGDTVYCGIDDNIKQVNISKEIKDQVALAITNISGIVNQQIDVDSLFLGTDGTYSLNGVYNSKTLSGIVSLDDKLPVVTELYSEIDGVIIEVSSPRGILQSYDVEIAEQEIFNEALCNILNSIESMNLGSIV